MTRTQILLDDWQYERLKAMSEREGKSLGSLVRTAVARFLEEEPRSAATRLAEIAGIGSDAGASGRDHDDVIYGPRRERD